MSVHLTPGFYQLRRFPPLSCPPSDLRQVPDHQEVFASREDGVSIVIEVLSFEEEIPSEDGTKKNADGGGDGGGGGGGGSSARHFFDDLAAANGASSSTCDFCADMTDRRGRCFCGDEKIVIHKFVFIKPGAGCAAAAVAAAVRLCCFFLLVVVLLLGVCTLALLASPK